MKIELLIKLILPTVFICLNCIDLTEHDFEYIFFKYGLTKTDSTGNILEDFGDWQPREDDNDEYIYFIPPYPNPCQNGITIKYYLKIKVKVWVSLWHCQWDQEYYPTNFIKDLVKAEQDTGFHEIYWDCTDKYGNVLPSGFYRIGLNLQFEKYDISYSGGNIQVIR